VSLHRSHGLRILVLSGLFVAVPLVAFEQRFGGPSASQRGTNVQNPPAQTPAPGTPGQRSGGPGGPTQGPWEWWKDDAIKKEMRLTDMQARNITKIYEERARMMKPHSDEFDKQRLELEKMTKERAVDVATYSMQVNKVEFLRTELSKSRLVMLYQIYRQLTPEQYDKLREIRDRRDRQRAGRGAGTVR